MELFDVMAYALSILFLKYPVSATQNCEGFWESWTLRKCANGTECLVQITEPKQVWIDGTLKCNGGIPDNDIIKCGNITNVEELRLENCILHQLNATEFLQENEPSVIHIYYNVTAKLAPINVDFSGIPSLRTITVVGSRTRGNLNWIFDQEENHISSLVISDHDIVTFPKQLFKDMGALKVLRIENGKLESVGNQTFLGLRSLMVLSLVGNHINIIEPAAFKELRSLLWLDLSKNEISVVPTASLQWLESLQFIDLSYNVLELLPYSLTTLGHLLVVNVQNNNLTVLPPFLTNSTVDFQIALSGNKWNCNCRFCMSVKWMKENNKSIMDYETLSCIKYTRRNDVLVELDINNSTVEELCKCMAFEKGFTILSICILASLLALLMLISLPLVLVYRKYRAGPIKKPTGAKLPSEKTMYDAFVWSHCSDIKFVNQMISTLEPEHRLFLHQRDWLSYEYSRDKVIYSMENSSFAILVISRNFINSDIFQVQFRSFYHEMPAKRKSIIPIFLKDVNSEKMLPPEFRNLWHQSNRLTWDDKLMWKKLLHILSPTGRYI